MESVSSRPAYVIDDDEDDNDETAVDETVATAEIPQGIVYSLHPTPIFGVGVSIFSSLLWGMYPVLCRYVMLHQPGKPQSTALLAVLMTINSTIIGAYYCFRPSNQTTNSNRNHNNNNNTGKSHGNNKLKVACLYGLLCLARMQSNMASTRMTKAYNTQMTAMSLPFFTAFLARIFLFEKIHSALLPALILMLLGGFLVFYGQGAFDKSSDAGNGFSTEDLLGVLLQLFSVVFSAGVKIAFKSTEGVLDKTELLLSQFFTSALPLLPYALLFEYSSVHALLFELDTNGILCMIGLAFGIYIVGNATQIYAARSIGASNHAASNSMRLVSAVLGSALVLHEPLDGIAEWIGMVLIVVSTLGYWYIRNRKNDDDDDGVVANVVNTISIDKQRRISSTEGMSVDNIGIEMGNSNGGVVYNPLANEDGHRTNVRINDYEDTSIDVSRHDMRDEEDEKANAEAEGRGRPCYNRAVATSLL